MSLVSSAVVSSRVFRNQFLAGLRAAFDRGALRFPGRLAGQQAPAAWSAFVAALAGKDWVVYAKPPFGGPAQGLKDLARYRHPVALRNRRLPARRYRRLTFPYT